jgi:hypothetical protein
MSGREYVSERQLGHRVSTRSPTNIRALAQTRFLVLLLLVQQTIVNHKDAKNPGLFEYRLFSITLALKRHPHLLAKGRINRK